MHLSLAPTSPRSKQRRHARFSRPDGLASTSASVADLTFLLASWRVIRRNVNPKPHYNHRVASVPLLPTLVKVPAAKRYKRRKRDTSDITGCSATDSLKTEYVIHGASCDSLFR